MCDIVPGQVIVSHPSDWNVGLRDFGRARYRESMEQRLEALRLRLSRRFPLSLHLLEVEPGEENHTIATLYDWFAVRHYPDQPQIGPNYQLTVNSGASSSPQSISAQSFTFSSDYPTYQRATGLPQRAATPRRILIVDTGIASDHQLNLHSSRNILDPAQTAIDDDNGHGTAVALLIADLAPNDELIIYKAADAAGDMNEWDLLAALSADSGANVVNLSVEYGLANRNCSLCGRQSSSSRSTVFESVLDSTANWTNPPVIVAAAGNGRGTKLAYPARFSDIVAVGAVNSSKDLSAPSNSGSSDHRGNMHQNHFAAPGGDADPSRSEYVIELANGVQYLGTSFACAFASATVLAAMDSLGGSDPTQVLHHLRRNADASMSTFSNSDHGHGLIHV